MRATWDERITASVANLDFEKEFTDAGESWSEADGEGHVVARNDR